MLTSDLFEQCRSRLQSAMKRDAKRWFRPRRRSYSNVPAMIELLEPRRVLAANVVSVVVVGDFIYLTDSASGKAAKGDSVSISYTANQITLTGNNGTQFLKDGLTLSSVPITTANPAHLYVYLDSPASAVQVTGDGAAKLASFDINFGPRKSQNSLTLIKVQADSVGIVGSPGIENVTLDTSTVNGPLSALLGKKADDTLTIKNSTVNGPFVATAQKITVDHDTFGGTVLLTEGGYRGQFDTTASTYNGSMEDVLGRDGVVNEHASPDGPNKFHSSEILIGWAGKHHTVVNVPANSVVNDVAPTLTGAAIVKQPPLAPTVKSITPNSSSTALTGTWDSTSATKLTVTVGTKTYTLGTDAALTTPTPGNWSLDLTGANLPVGVTNVTVVNKDSSGASSQGTGTITLKVPVAPTVNAATVATTATGTWDSTLATTLQVTVGGKTLTLNTDAALTSPSAGKWSLDLTGLGLTPGANTVTVVNKNDFGSTNGTGSITLVNPAELTSIHTFLTNNNLTATQTSTGLNYVVTTPGTGALPTSGQTLLVNYTGHILNANGTLGTEFDSSVDAQFNHVTPFTFKLGQGAVIAGWDEAFALLPVGTVAKLLIPAESAYGSQVKANIPANSILVFDVTLVSAA